MIPAARPIPVVLAMLALAACGAREDEGALRARLAQWVALGETVRFEAKRDCAAGLFRVVDPAPRAALPVRSDPRAMLRARDMRGVAALAMPGRSPDQAIVALVNTDRAAGQLMRRTALEGHACMDDVTESAFAQLLAAPGVLLADDARNGAVMLLDPKTRLLVVVMGAAP